MQNHRRKKRTTRLLAAVFVLAGGVVCAMGCESTASKASPAAEAESGESTSKNEVDPIPVETMSVHAEDYTETFSSFGTVEPVDSVTVSAEAGGRALDVPFEEGQRIKAGSRLIRVDTQVDSARIDVLENQVEAAQREYERTKRLHGEGLATDQQLDQAESSLESAQLNLTQAKVAASKGGVRSPVSGFVHRKMVEEGEFVSPGAPVATIVGMDELKVIANVPESRLKFVEEGDQVDVTIPAVDTDFSGTIHRIGLDAIAPTRTYPVEVRVQNEDGSLRPGMYARANFVKKRWKDAVLIPRDSVLQGFSGAEAMVYPSEDSDTAEAELHQLDLGPNAGAQVLVKSGVNAGDRLIVRGHRGLVDGALVRQVNHWESLEEFRNPQGRIDLSSSDDEGEDSEQ
ncbi:MAG: efflux RND transporter periplasmic adaptor subunit [Myxococcota bacterium]